MKKPSKSVINALKAVAVLAIISIVCVGLLAVCNMFFPKYKPSLDMDTLKLINEICPTGVSDDEAMNGKYIVMLDEDELGAFDAFNKTNKSMKASVLAVYAELKGDNAGAHVFECSATGRDGDIVILVAYKDGKVFGASVKKQGESYFNKLPEDVLDNAEDTDGSVNLNDIVGKTGATLSLKAITRALNISAVYEKENSAKIDDVMQKTAIGGDENDGNGEGANND